MTARPRGRGFRSLGEAGHSGLGLPPAKARELWLATAWRRVAGDALSHRIVALRAFRGTLDLEIPEKRWIEAFAAGTRDLSRRLAAEAPGLGLRRVRVRVVGETAPVDSFELDAFTRAPHSRSDPGPVRTAEGTQPEGVRTSRDELQRLRERYLRAGAARPRGAPPPTGQDGRP